MPQAIPEGLTREHVLRAIADLDTRPEHSLGEPTGYELWHEGRPYPPKAVVGFAYRHLAGRVLRPDEFSGGEAAGQANHVLRRLGFEVVEKRRGATGVSEGPVGREYDRRMGMRSSLSRGGGPAGVAPARLRELGVYGGAQGIWVGTARTGDLTPGGGGITVAVLHTGRSYADDLAEDCVLYHYPSTRRPPGRDAAEVEATKVSGRLGLPLFVVTYPAPNPNTRDVRLGWVEDWDDETRTFLISFGDRTVVQATAPPAGGEPFQLVDEAGRSSHTVLARPGQQRFKFRVLKRYGPRCAVCGLDVLELLDDAHLRP
jgi:putative restriction endonuclease